jgi:hypothetical protein
VPSVAVECRLLSIGQEITRSFTGFSRRRSRSRLLLLLDDPLELEELVVDESGLLDSVSLSSVYKGRLLSTGHEIFSFVSCFR